MRVMMLVLLASSALGQTRSSPEGQPSPLPAPQHESRAPQDRQQRASQLIRAVEAEADGLDSGMRAWALWQLGRAQQQNNRKKALELLDRALMATRSLTDEPSGMPPAGAESTATGGRPLSVRAYLEQQIAQTIASLAPEDSTELLNRVQPDSRPAVLSGLLRYYQEQKRTDQALACIYRIAAETEMPYAEAMQVMSTLKPEQSTDLVQLFAASLASYREHSPHLSPALDAGGFPAMVTSYWNRVPRQVARDAIDEILKQADNSRRADSDSSPVITSVTRSTSKGSVSFRSAYEYRLFQMLPVLSQIDNSAAQDYLEKYREVADMFQKYPDGLVSSKPPAWSSLFF